MSALEYNLDEILAVAKEAVLLAGKEIRLCMLSTGTRADDGMTTKSNSVDLVTETDAKCEDLIQNLLRSKYPQHQIIGEETSSSSGNGMYELTDEPTWTIDPIDGTTNFVHKLSLTCVLVSFLVNREPLVSVTYDPMADEMFWSIRKQGAFMKDREGSVRKLSVSDTKSLTKSVISMDAGYGRDPVAVQKFTSVQSAILLKQVRHVRVLGSCGLTMAYVACGRLDAGFEEGSWERNCGPKIWDFAGGKLLIQEAGGVTRDITNRKSKDTQLDLMQRSVFMAATSELADELLDTIYSAK